MIMLVIGAVLALQPPSDATCAAAFALQSQHMQESGELPDPAADPQNLTQAQKTAVAAARRVIVQGVFWTALATRTAQGRTEANQAFRALAKSLKEADAAYVACDAIAFQARMPAIAEPPKPVDGQGECVAEVGAFYSAVRACASLEVLRAQAQASQSKLEQGTLTCRSKDQARTIWAQLGAAAAGADSQVQRARCAAR